MRAALLLLTVLGLGAMPHTQSPQFVLSSLDRARLVAVDFTAIGTNGAPVATLTPGDITVRIGGRIRRAVALDFVRVRQGDAGVAAPYGDNATPPAPRSLILIVDEDTIRPGRTGAVRDAAQKLVAGLSPQDRLALVTVPFGGLRVNFTADHGRVLQAMTSLSAQSSRAETAEDAQCRTLTTLNAISDLLSVLTDVEAPVTVVLFSSHQAGPQNEFRTLGQAPTSGPCELRAANFTTLGHAAAGAKARFYIVHSDIDQRSRSLDGLEHIAGVTGGSLLYLSTNQGHPAVDRILAESEGYYVARIAREPFDAAGTVQDVSVTSSLPNVTIQRTPQLVIPPASRAPAMVGMAPRSARELIQQGPFAGDLPLRVTVHAFRDDNPSKIRLAVTLDSPVGSAVLASAVIGAFDDRGQFVAGLEMSAEALQQRPVTAALSVAPGTYRLRAAATESSGRGGTVEQRMDATLTRIGPVTASALMLGLSREGGFVPALEFSTEPAAFGLLELYGAVAPAPSVVFEIATTEMGPAVLTIRGVVEPSASATRAVATAALPIAQLPPGDYVVRATVTPDRGASGRVIRTLRKVRVQPIEKPPD